MPDNTAPRRRWFQFKLSTWFVLVGILAWAMMEWPWVQDVIISDGKTFPIYHATEAETGLIGYTEFVGPLPLKWYDLSAADRRHVLNCDLL